MAKVSFKRGPFASLKYLEIKDGQIIFTTDTGEMYLDMPNGNEIIRKQFVSGKAIEFEIVEELPVEDIRTNVIYLVPAAAEEEYQIYNEYVYVNGAWEKIGTTKIDLSNYYTKEEIDNKLNKDIFVAEYNSTYISSTYEELHEAYESGKLLFCHYYYSTDNNAKDMILPLVSHSYGIPAGEWFYFSNTNNENENINITFEHIVNENPDTGEISIQDYWNLQNIDLQQKLISGNNIKTINGQSILGSGDLETSYGFSKSETDFEQNITEIDEELFNIICNYMNNNKVIYFKYFDPTTVQLLYSTCYFNSNSEIIFFGNDRSENICFSKLYYDTLEQKYYLTKPSIASNYYTKTEVDNKLSNKVNKKLPSSVKSSMNLCGIYGKNVSTASDWAVSVLNYDKTEMGTTVPLRDPQGRLATSIINDPIEDYHVTSKKYVDDKISKDIITLNELEDEHTRILSYTWALGKIQYLYDRYRQKVTTFIGVYNNNGDPAWLTLSQITITNDNVDTIPNE